MTVAIIPAKGSSSRIPGKNIRMFHGKPIIAYSIEAAEKSGLFETIVVSTDSEEVSEVAQKSGADIMIRGQEWCVDSVGPLDVARHTLSLMKPADLCCVIYATAPLMSVADLTMGWNAVQIRGVEYSCSVGTTPFLHDAAQFFWCRTWALNEHRPEFGVNTVMVPVSTERDCDINTMEDWKKAETMFQTLQGR